MLRPGQRVIAAVSGGPDSVCLLHLLAAIAPRLGVTLAGIAHVNHKLRGEASEEDERFVRELAARYGLAFYSQEARVSEQPGNLEDAARRTRLEFFARLMREGAADRIATGHTRDDQAETVLFRLLRGSGTAGIAGILPVTKTGLIRPLLDVTRAEVEEYLGSHGLEWREDASNRDLGFARNRIRWGLLPQLAREWNPRIGEALAHAAEIAQEEERWWEAEIERIAAAVLVEAGGGIEARAADLAALPKAVARRVVRFAAAKTGVAIPGFEDVERVLELAGRRRGEGKLAPGGLEVMRSFGWLRFSRLASRAATPPIPLDPPARVVWEDGSVIHVEIVETKPTETKCSRHICARLKVRGALAPLELRTWRAGDHYRPAGSSRNYTIQELFQRARVPSWRRRSWPIISTGSRIVWVRQFGAAAEFVRNGAGPTLEIWEETGAPAASSKSRSAS